VWSETSERNRHFCEMGDKRESKLIGEDERTVGKRRSVLGGKREESDVRLGEK